MNNFPRHFCAVVCTIVLTLICASANAQSCEYSRPHLVVTNERSDQILVTVFGDVGEDTRRSAKSGETDPKPVVLNIAPKSDTKYYFDEAPLKYFAGYPWLIYKMKVSLAANKKDMGTAEWIPPFPVYSCDNGKNYYGVRIIIFDEKRTDAWFKYGWRFKDAGFGMSWTAPKK